MCRRLATFAVAITLTACSDVFDAPTGVSRQQVLEDTPTSLPPQECVGYIVDEISIPQCVEPPYWLETRERHDFESVTVQAAGGGRGGRGGRALF